MPAEEVEFYWPQIWYVRYSRRLEGLADSSHLMITYPTTSNALESFVLDRAEESTHSAMLVRALVSGRKTTLTADILVYAIRPEGSDADTDNQSRSIPNLSTNPLSMP